VKACFAVLQQIQSVAATHRLTQGDLTFAAAAARDRNSLPSATRFAPSLDEFCRQLRTLLFRSSFH
jgi:hypothetical protein